jgi:hypothetical protein
MQSEVTDLIARLRARCAYGDSRLWRKHDPLANEAANMLANLQAALSAAPPAQPVTDACPDCGRNKAKNADDAAKGLCPKWWAVRDAMADEDCERHTCKELCPVCANRLNPSDLCAVDIELGVCHFVCLEGTPTVDLETREPVDEKKSTFLYATLDPAPPAQNAAVEAEPVAFRCRSSEDRWALYDTLSRAMVHSRHGAVPIEPLYSADTLAARDARIAEMEKRERLLIREAAAHFSRSCMLAVRAEDAEARVTALKEELQRVREVKVKPLEWEDRSGSLYANSVMGEVCIDEHYDGFSVIADGRLCEGFASREAAQNFVQKKHEAWVSDWLVCAALSPLDGAASEGGSR